MKLIHYCYLICFSMLLCGSAQAVTKRDAVLAARLQQVVDTMNGKIGIGVLGLDFPGNVLVNNEHHYPMQSVFKFPLAMAILYKVDKGQLSLKQKIHIAQSELDTATWSPLVHDHPHSDVDITLEDLLIYTVSKSDNNTCDVLFRLAGGTKYVNDYIHSLGVKEIAIAATEVQMKTGWPVQYTNWCTPSSMLQLLQLLYDGKVLTAGSRSFLTQCMTQSENSPNRIKGRLPGTAVVAHKTGTSNSRSGITAATNDVGIITLPGGHHLAIVVYVSDYTGGVPSGENRIAELSKIIWEVYATNE